MLLVILLGVLVIIVRGGDSAPAAYVADNTPWCAAGNPSGCGSDHYPGCDSAGAGAAGCAALFRSKPVPTGGDLFIVMQCNAMQCDVM